MVNTKFWNRIAIENISGVVQHQKISVCGYRYNRCTKWTSNKLDYFLQLKRSITFSSYQFSIDLYSLEIEKSWKSIACSQKWTIIETSKLFPAHTPIFRSKYGSWLATLKKTNKLINFILIQWNRTGWQAWFNPKCNSRKVQISYMGQ